MKHFFLYFTTCLLLFSISCTPQDQQITTTDTISSLAAKPIPQPVTVVAYDPVMVDDQIKVNIGLIGDSVRLFGMNIRFVYPSDMLTFKGFTDYAPGYGPQLPDPARQNLLKGISWTWFGINGAATYVNGAVQLLDKTQMPTYANDSIPTRYFSLLFDIKGGADCPVIILDKKLNGGSYAPGSAGVVVTIVAPPGGRYESAPTTVTCDHLNWRLVQHTAPYGHPLLDECIHDPI